MKKWVLIYVVTLAAIPGAYFLGRRHAASTERDLASAPTPPPLTVAPAPTSVEGHGATNSAAERTDAPSLQSLLDQPPSPQRDKLLADYFFALGRKERAAAFAKIADLKGRVRDQAVTAILLGWAKDDPRGAWNRAVDDVLAGGLEWTDARAGTATGPLMLLTATLFRDGRREELVQLIDGLPVGRNKDLLSGMYAKLLMQYDSTAAMEYIGRLTGAERQTALRSAARDLAKEAPAQTAEWALRLPSEESAQALRAAVGEWIARDTTAALGWMQQQAASPNLDAAIDVFVSEASLETLRANPDLLNRYSSDKRKEAGRARLTHRLRALEKQLGTP